MSDTATRARTAIILPGAGARSAYQVGAIKALAELLPPTAPLPFGVVVGTSAGAILGAVLASHAPRFRLGAANLERVWRNFHIDQVIRVDAPSMLRAACHWLVALMSAGILAPLPRSVFDSSPLRKLLARHVHFERIRHNLDRGWLAAFAVSASAYQSARSIAFFECAGDRPGWRRSWREGQRAELTLDHLMASTAVPFLFPPVAMGGEYYGDGAMRQVAPLSPAIHLGADRLLVLTVRPPLGLPAPPATGPGPPALGQIFGFMLDTLFLDGLDTDLDRLYRDNLLAASGRAEALGLRVVRPLIISPSEDLGAIAARHAKLLPRTMRVLLRMLGAGDGEGQQLLSYLLFESAYTRQLIALGYADVRARSAELSEFLAAA
jgi:NTE family protein